VLLLLVPGSAAMSISAAVSACIKY
jgi:hypothetical protein